MRIKALVCNCKGLSPSFKNSDMNTLPFEIESYLRERLLSGEDEIAYTLRGYGSLVKEHEAAVPKWLRPRS